MFSWGAGQVTRQWKKLSPGPRTCKGQGARKAPGKVSSPRKMGSVKGTGNRLRALGIWLWRTVPGHKEAHADCEAKFSRDGTAHQRRKNQTHELCHSRKATHQVQSHPTSPKSPGVYHLALRAQGLLWDLQKEAQCVKPRSQRNSIVSGVRG